MSDEPKWHVDFMQSGPSSVKSILETLRAADELRTLADKLANRDDEPVGMNLIAEEFLKQAALQAARDLISFRALRVARDNLLAANAEADDKRTKAFMHHFNVAKLGKDYLSQPDDEQDPHGE